MLPYLPCCLPCVPTPLFMYRVACAQEESDVPYEEEILRHPFQVKCWMRYVEHKKAAGGKGGAAAVNMIYERALKQLPGR